MSYKFLTLTVEPDTQDTVGRLTINRPESLNALNKALMEELHQAVEEMNSRPNLRCVIFTGAGEKAFVAGADIKEMQSYTREQAHGMAEGGQRVFQAIEDSRVATIAAVNGFALGGGLELAMACDFMVASEAARFGLPEVTLGLIPGYGGTQRLPRYVGKALARMITFTGDIYSAKQGYDWGLFAQVVPPAELMPACLKLAKNIASRSPAAIRLAKDAINEGFNFTQAEGLALEAEQFAKTFTTQDHNEGIAAFLAKRKPQFTGN
jgi:enoyl-CoA hydratase